MAQSLRAPSPSDSPELYQPVRFFHPKTGRRYRIGIAREAVIEEFFLDRHGRQVYSDPRKVSFVIGSGAHARSFLVQQDGRLYQAPVTFYTQARRWDMSPGYDSETYIGFTRRLTASCLFCHSGRLNVSNGSGDRFDEQRPFLEPAIGCERCHGPGGGHPGGSQQALVNPARLPPALRDQVCEQCHLFGAARVRQPGKNLLEYRPGLALGEFVSIYVYENGLSQSPGVVSHAEEVRASACRRGSGGKLWCGSCHRIHTPVASWEKDAFYRARCLECHTATSCTRRPDPASQAHQQDRCTACHMPGRPVAESSHVTFTDHRILRRPRPQSGAESQPVKLKAALAPPAADGHAAARNLGFAYLQAASATGRVEFHRVAVDILLPLAETDLADSEFWENLGESYLALGRPAEAAGAFRRAVGTGQASASAYYGLGYVSQLSGRLEEAVEMYRKALRIDPAKAEALGNLAAAYRALGRTGLARDAFETAVRLEPGNLRWRTALEDLRRPAQ